jgi:hypothetical protein
VTTGLLLMNVWPYYGRARASAGMPHMHANLNAPAIQRLSWLSGPRPSRTILTRGAHAAHQNSPACRNIIKFSTKNRRTECIEGRANVYFPDSTSPLIPGHVHLADVPSKARRSAQQGNDANPAAARPRQGIARTHPIRVRAPACHTTAWQFPQELP